MNIFRTFASPLLICALLGAGNLPSLTAQNSPDAGKAGVEKVSYLGVFTKELGPDLRQHMDMPDGFGLQVGHVCEKGPAHAGGVKAHDILTKFDDQLLTTPEHLATLVRSRKKGENVSITLVRKGVEKVVEVTLADRELPANAIRGGIYVSPNTKENIEQWQDAMERYQAELKKRTGAAVKENDVASVEKPSGKPPGISVSPGYPIQVIGTKDVVKIKNDHGEVTIERAGEKHKLNIQDPAGTVIFDGDFDPEAGTKALPENARNHLEKMKLNDLKVFAPGEHPLAVPPEVPAVEAESIETISDPNPEKTKKATGPTPL